MNRYNLLRQVQKELPYRHLGYSVSLDDIQGKSFIVISNGGFQESWTLSTWKGRANWIPKGASREIFRCDLEDLTLGWEFQGWDNTFKIIKRVRFPEGFPFYLETCGFYDVRVETWHCKFKIWPKGACTLYLPAIEDEPIEVKINPTHLKSTADFEEFKWELELVERAKARVNRHLGRSGE